VPFCIAECVGGGGYVRTDTGDLVKTTPRDVACGSGEFDTERGYVAHGRVFEAIDGRAWNTLVDTATASIQM
jgi:hypothetical protein